jgi:tight adherence protein C
LISGLTFLATFLLLVGLLRPRSSEVEARIDDLLASPQAVRPVGMGVAGGFLERVLSPVLRGLGRAVGGLTPPGVLKRMRAKLDMAGNPRFPGLAEYLALKVLSAAAIIPVGLFGVGYLELPELARVLALVVVIGLGAWLPDIVLQRIIEARQAAIRRALPDVVDLLVVSMEAGLGFDRAMQLAVTKGHGPLAEELGRVLEEVRLGRGRGEAMREMAQRTQVSDLASFVAAVRQAETMGVSIVKALRAQAEVGRRRRSERAREASAKLPVKLLFPLVFFIFPALFVVILGPAAIRFTALFRVLGK